MPADSGTAPDKRSEPRVSVRGLVQLVSPEGLRIQANLIDVSRSGFRAMHTHAELRTGTMLRFRHPSASGQARVVWNRITGATVESGFNIIG